MLNLDQIKLIRDQISGDRDYPVLRSEVMIDHPLSGVRPTLVLVQYQLSLVSEARGTTTGDCLCDHSIEILMGARVQGQKDLLDSLRWCSGGSIDEVCMSPFGMLSPLTIPVSILIFDHFIPAWSGSERYLQGSSRSRR